jgi:cytochrome c oxidase assembly protein subunit 11
MSIATDNRRLFVRLAVVAAAMFGFGYALVPFYYQICAAWGVNSLGEVPAKPVNTQIDRSRTVTIELDSNAHGLPWRFRPLVRHIDVHPGELTTVEYEVVNERNEPVTAQAVPSYGPALAAAYFNKLECICFTQQTLAPGETRRLPVLFVVDPRLPKDVNSIALSYTFFELTARGAKG